MPVYASFSGAYGVRFKIVAFVHLFQALGGAERGIVAIVHPFQALGEAECKIVAIVHQFGYKSPDCP
ncbi:hypothetical protein G8C92_09015 [Paenibacillus donghaensis]|uniref:hypothetical protein n=1 Tax=Paenibacillus donghaensis TaxID=414771 RepID=UPI0018838AF5|nr:hypothetical protein [Paenibacillus donghaensis]MBE9914172.1 hypothetical protein [Paenibacillus donghaensis]